MTLNDSLLLISTMLEKEGKLTLSHDVESAVERIAELEKALKSTNAELLGAIDQVNHFFECHHPSNSLDEPERWDKQTCFENQVLLKESK